MEYRFNCIITTCRDLSTHQVQSSQHDIERVHLWSDQLLPVDLHLHTVTK